MRNEHNGILTVLPPVHARDTYRNWLVMRWLLGCSFVENIPTKSTSKRTAHFERDIWLKQFETTMTECVDVAADISVFAFHLNLFC